MNFTTILIFAIGLILYALIRSTETVLEIRQKRREHGDDSKAYL